MDTNTSANFSLADEFSEMLIFVREHFRSPCRGRLYDFCTIRANAQEVIDSRRVKMVDLVGIEPTTSSMPWKRAPSCATGPQGT